MNMKATQRLLPRFFAPFAFLFALACAFPAVAQAPFYAIGNRVWFDTDNSGAINGAETGIDGVTVNLYAAGNLSTALATTTTANGGYYLFDGLDAGDYVVSVASSNFTGALNGYRSSGTTISPAGIVSETTAALANSDIDSDDNGTLQTAGTLNGAVISSTITLGPTGATEPTGETDLENGVGQGSQPDGHANMTVDFGFYTMSLGNLVWSDTDKNGAFNGSETGINGVNVELWSADGTTQLATTTTAGNGLYSFSGLAQGDYTVRVTSPVGAFSSVDTFAPADTTNPTTNTDDNDNGVGTGSGTIVSNTVTITPGAAQTSNTVDNNTGSTTNPTMDFGFTPVFSLGNRVWFDTDNSSTINGTEVGIDGVTVNLYAASDLTTVLATQITANGGYYLFNGLQSGDYVVAIPSIEFTAGNPLVGYWSSATTRAANGTISETTAALANSDTDSDDNGTLQTSGALNGAVISSTVTLGPALTEPSGETDLDATLPGNQQGQPDTQANMTVDFGFYTMSLGNLVWNDLDNSGLLDGAEVGIDGVTVELWSGDGSTEINVGPDGVLGTTDDAPGGMSTSGGGLYTFSGLPAGDYIVRLPAVNFNPGGVLRDFHSSTGPLPALAYEPAPDPNINRTDSDDNGSEANGLLGLGGYIQSLAITLTAAGQQSANDAQGATVENRLDFGVNNLPQLDLTASVTDGQGSYTPGTTLNYDIVVTNHGPADANGMSVTAARPAQIVSWTWTCAGGTPPAYNCTDSVGNPATFTDSLDLPQLASVTYHVTAQVAASASGDLTVMLVANPPNGMTDETPLDNIATDTDTFAVTMPLAIPALNVWGLSILGLLLAAILGLRAGEAREKR
ncbi:MAG: SdrD B-like domain-containing protein [Candidatus Contendobacter sp.]|nr:SdrD B-like domain-containing protein [Candidatus Contendobacter sp.]MDS4060094.1 SdrD B-like domain-containing protein [Candidatus Contendobacter sp.]